MLLRAALCFACQCLVLSLCGDVAAQLTITNPATGAIRQVAASMPEGIVAHRREASSRTQIRVTVRYLMVDDATRTAIYEGLEGIQNTTELAVVAAAADLQTVEHRCKSLQRAVAPGRVTSCVLTDSEVSRIVRLASDSPASDVSNAPNILLLDGKEAEMNDVVQHPFVIDVETDGDTIEPSVKAFDDGLRLRLLAGLREPAEPSSAVNPQPAIDFRFEMVLTRLLEVKSDRLFGLQDEPLTVQTPKHQITTVTGAQLLTEGQTLLVDPHIAKTKVVHRETSVPVIGKIPYVGRNFRNVDVADVEQYMMLLLQPTVAGRKSDE